MNSTEADVITQVRAFIHENFLYMRPNFEVGADDRLLEQGIIDSMGMLQLVTFLEETFGIRPADDELVPENLDSIDRIASFVMRKRSQAKGAR